MKLLAIQYSDVIHLLFFKARELCKEELPVSHQISAAVDVLMFVWQ